MNSLAIVIPYYRKAFFRETIESLVEQTDKRFRVYIGDDASPEEALDIFSSFEPQLNIIYRSFKENFGSKSLVLHWDRCIELIQDEQWIMILGDDDVLDKKLVEVFYKNLEIIEKNKLSVVKFSTKVIDKNSNLLYEKECQKSIIKSTDSFYNKITNQTRSSLSEHIFRRSVYDSYGFREYNLAWHSDDMAWLEFSNFQNIFCINEATVKIRISDISISGDDALKNKKDKASFRFYSDLISTYLYKFERTQRGLIIRIYESLLINIKGKNLNSFIKISKLFIKNFLFISFGIFVGRFIFKEFKKF